MDRIVTAIVPTFNEAQRIGPVLEVLSSYPHFQEVLVVDDGSTDTTAQIVQKYPVRYLTHSPNRGKGYAMEQGVAACDSPVIFFCDADVRGLTHEIITAILAPVLAGQVEMNIAMRHHTVFYIPFVLRFAFHLGGERALTRTLWEKLPPHYKERFRIEPALNYYAKHYGKGFSYLFFPQLKQTIKEKKLGIWQGHLARWRMAHDIFTAQVELLRAPRPPQPKKNFE